jgi:serine/threonine-protein phosphatase 5
VLKCAPKDADAKRKCDECDKLLRERAFAKAIAGEVEKPISTTLDINSIEVSSSYTGLCLDPETGITFEFVQSMINEFKEQRKIHYKYAYQIIIAAIGVLSKEKTVVDIEVPEGRRITVCGDVHGQYYDVLNIFQMNGLPSNENPYVFNGDFVDRGSFSAEIILTFFAFKVLYPRGIFLMRGNHETNNMNKMYGFEGEMVAKYNRDGFLLCAEAFCHLPLCSVLGNKVLILHGGLFSDDKVTLADLRALDRNRQPPESGPMSELLWSDPQKAHGRGPSKRGVGSSFGPDITHKFLDANNLGTREFRTS